MAFFEYVVFLNGKAIGVIYCSPQFKREIAWRMIRNSDLQFDPMPEIKIEPKRKVVKSGIDITQLLQWPYWEKK